MVLEMAKMGRKKGEEAGCHGKQSEGKRFLI
jgi:hypothetical protein